MKTKNLEPLIDGALSSLREALEAGKSEGLLAFLAAAARFSDYSFRNVMLIAAQRPDATHVAGFRAWKKLGRFVRRGEKGIAIVAPMPLRRDENPRTEDEEPPVRFRAVYVFDVSQTDGEPLPEAPEVSGDPRAFTAKLRELIRSQGISLSTVDYLPGANGSSSGGRITLASGLAPAEEFSVLVHELAHEMLHHTPAETRPPKEVRETEAEAVAFVVSEAVGLSARTAASDYIQLARGDAETLASSLERIQQTAKAILEGLLPENSAQEAA